MNKNDTSEAPAPLGPPGKALDKWEREHEAERADMGRLLQNIKARLPELEALLRQQDFRRWEDLFYRFYHQSFKVYWLQESTEQLVAVLRSLLPERPLNKWFEQIVREGTGKEWQLEHNERWLQEARPILEAYFHARTMLDFAIRSGKELEEAPQSLPSAWAAVLYLFDLR
jgi:hypothetical protein